MWSVISEEQIVAMQIRHLHGYCSDKLCFKIILLCNIIDLCCVLIKSLACWGYTGFKEQQNVKRLSCTYHSLLHKYSFYWPVAAFCCLRCDEDGSIQHHSVLYILIYKPHIMLCVVPPRTKHLIYQLMQSMQRGDTLN